MITLRSYRGEELGEIVAIWNDVIKSGCFFPADKELSIEEGEKFFGEQSFTGVAFCEDTKEVVGVYILHPNGVGHCSHICNTSYAVKQSARGHKVGESLVRHSFKTAEELGFEIVQLNVVVASNKPALSMYKKLGFVQLGKIPKGYKKTDGSYEDIIPHYRKL